MAESTQQNDQYALAAKAFGEGLSRLARGYEADADERRDLLQNIHLALWRSLAIFDHRCSLRTWVYRVAHNVGASHVVGRRARGSRLTTLEGLEFAVEGATPEETVGVSEALARVMSIVHRLKPTDRQLMLLYLEDFEAAEIADVTGLSPGAVATRIHRVKALLAAAFREAGSK